MFSCLVNRLSWTKEDHPQNFAIECNEKKVAGENPPRKQMSDRYFEDYARGAVNEYGSIAVEESEIIACARRFDQQPLHTDLVAAKQSVFGGLIASGWGTLRAWR
jgi:acyl dehydratase